MIFVKEFLVVNNFTWNIIKQKTPSELIFIWIFKSSWQFIIKHVLLSGKYFSGNTDCYIKIIFYNRLGVLISSKLPQMKNDILKIYFLDQSYILLDQLYAEWF